MIFYVWLISFFFLVDEVMKNKNRLHDFLYDVFRLQGKKGKTKMKNNKKINKLLRNIFVYCNFVNQNEKRKMKWAKQKLAIEAYCVLWLPVSVTWGGALLSFFAAGLFNVHKVV